MAQPTQQPTERRLLRLHPDDDCLVAAVSLRAGEAVEVEGTLVELGADLPVGHKVAAHALAAGRPVRKCGAIIGRTTVDVTAGEHLHLHNLRSDYLPAHLVGGADAGEHAWRPSGSGPRLSAPDKRRRTAPARRPARAWRT